MVCLIVTLSACLFVWFTNKEMDQTKSHKFLAPYFFWFCRPWKRITHLSSLCASSGLHPRPFIFVTSSRKVETLLGIPGPSVIIDHKTIKRYSSRQFPLPSLRGNEANNESTLHYCSLWVLIWRWKNIPPKSWWSTPRGWVWERGRSFDGMITHHVQGSHMVCLMPLYLLQPKKDKTGLRVYQVTS